MSHPLLARLGLDIPDDLLELALTHPSAVGEGLERTLEIQSTIGVSWAIRLVGAIVASYFYATESQLPEGELTARKIACVRPRSSGGGGAPHRTWVRI